MRGTGTTGGAARAAQSVTFATRSGLAFRILEAGHRLAIPRLFAARFLLSLCGIAISFALDLLSRLVLRNGHESAIAEEA